MGGNLRRNNLTCSSLGRGSAEKEKIRVEDSKFSFSHVRKKKGVPNNARRMGGGWIAQVKERKK